jgi:glycosyltransferase involved in cell wall biosynthesis
MRVLFISYSHLETNSGIQICNLAAQLANLGVECTIAVPDYRFIANNQPAASVFRVVSAEEVLQDPARWNFDLIHAWTPRERVRRITSKFRRVRSCPYIVHLEDNEEALVQSLTRVPFRYLRRLPRRLLDPLVWGGMVHPRRYGRFVDEAQGITVVIQALLAFCPPKTPTQTIWAGYQEDLPWDRPMDVAYRRRLGIDDSEYVVAYTGNAHVANRNDLRALYRAVEELHRCGTPVRLVRTGIDFVRVLGPKSSAYRRRYSVELGQVSRMHLPSVLSIADVLVQPGSAGPFNDFRFPSKVPEYLASGKPVLLADANIGTYLKDGAQCLLLKTGEPEEIAGKLARLFADVALRERIGAGGQEFARRNLRWSVLAGKLASFYDQVLGSA